ncbi:MAG: FtsW/RodA/SpoVE family cell cycle protein [Clostridia bacterium]|nr:FtsW/RodA/SpoVE family cell cycle protein [Clostridia bacterium]
MRKVKHLVPLLLVLLTNLIGFGVLYFTNRGIDNTILYCSVAVAAIVLISYAIILFASLGDEYLFLIVSMIFTIGIMFLLRSNTEIAMHQTMFFYVGMAGFFIVYVIYKKTNVFHTLKYSMAFIIVSVALFMFTLVFGSSIGGAKNWLSFGKIGIQPSEIIKIFFIMSLAGLLTYEADDDNSTLLKRIMNNNTKRQFFIMAVAFMFMGFLILQREWGSALLYFLIYFTMQYIFGSSKTVLFLTLLFAAGGSYLGVKTMTHIQQRITIWMDPFKNASDLGYQIVQSLYAMASGGVTGSGLGLGYPSYIPLYTNDFIFAAICEELGMIGGVGVMLLFFMLVYRGIKIALRSTNVYNKAVATGISAMFGYQTFIIIGGVTKFIPLTGITLPFVSAGGSSLAACFAALAILQAISAKTEEVSDVI